MSLKDLKCKVASFLIFLTEKILKSEEKTDQKNNDFAAENKAKIQLNQENIQKEVNEYVKNKGITSENFDSEKFQTDFMQYLKDKNYDCEGLEAKVGLVNPEEKNEEPVEEKKLPRNIQKISEDLNDCIDELEIFVHTTNMTPGLVCYTIEKIAPNPKKPYVTYCPAPRVIVQVHENGVNGGTIIMSYAHKFVKSVDFNDQKTAKVVSEDEALYTPLTKEHAIYVCKILNAQSRLFYMKQMKEQQKTK